jgi:hypothetical protein
MFRKFRNKMKLSRVPEVVNATVNPQKEGTEANNLSEKKHEAAEYVAS